MKYFLIILTFLSLFSCGNPKKALGLEPKKIQKIEPAGPEEYSYQLHDGGCSTGEHSFTTFDQACNALKDDELNRQCAYEQREELFINAECAGDFS